MRAALLGGVAFAATAFAADRAQAREPVPVLALDWTAPAECPDREHVEARVAQLIGRSRGDRTLEARATMTRSSTGPRYRLALRVDTTSTVSDERTMAGADCARLAEAAALVLALDIEQEGAPHVVEEPDAGAPTVSKTRETPPPAEPTRSPVERAPARAGSPRRGAWVDVRFGARLALDHGSLPKTTLGAGALVELERDPWILALAATAYRRQFVGGPRDRAGGAYVDLSTFEVDACWQRAIATYGVRACLGVELGSEGTRGVAIERSDTSSAFWGAANVGLQARPWQDRVIAPMAGVVVGHAFAAPDVVIQGFGTLFEAPFLFVRLQLGLEIRLF